MDKFDVLNRKLDMIFNEVIDMRERYECLLHDREVDELEKKAKLANDEVRWRQDDKRFLRDRFDEVRNRYYSVSEEHHRFKRNEETEVL